MTDKRFVVEIFKKIGSNTYNSIHFKTYTEEKEFEGAVDCLAQTFKYLNTFIKVSYHYEGNYTHAYIEVK